MPHNRSAQLVMDQEFLLIRAKMLEIAASLDRLDRAEGEASADPRWAQLHGALQIVASEGPGRVERIQLHFSRSYEADWQAQFQQSGGGSS